MHFWYVLESIFSGPFLTIKLGKVLIFWPKCRRQIGLMLYIYIYTQLSLSLLLSLPIFYSLCPSFPLVLCLCWSLVPHCHVFLISPSLSGFLYPVSFSLSLSLCVCVWFFFIGLAPSLSSSLSLSLAVPTLHGDFLAQPQDLPLSNDLPRSDLRRRNKYVFLFLEWKNWPGPV